ncbi:HNH endonuclease [Rhodococcus opacus]|uniref:HNH endonuclease n=1 Tax=Rhodococcus TaxID=1827 RepID=UPI0005C23AE6|nr:HNH endonuclease [Rhodococcus opacus]MDJ0415570.1 HNH endonuclease [Rhodococcus opacus]MDX5967916.1 HNH endonuclease [Rhodococcus opacus]NKY76622.1 HNH endonuclease [Rhodococcus opacus]QZS59328.1 HNH endonuclease [Rhodococcus opacus]RKM74092.1 HNH endonuclease [Rhodococcus opacus]
MDRTARLALAVDRQGGRCLWCGRRFGPLIPPTTEHLVPRLKGGPSITANEAAACRRCNADRGHTGPVDWLAQCRSRHGWAPQSSLLATLLNALDAELDHVGGHRRAKRYLSGQLRRCRNSP